MLARKQLDRDSLIGYARELGLDVERFTRELDSQLHLPRVQQDVALAERLEFFQTPTFVINGRLLIGERPLEKFTEIIDAELKGGQ